MYIDFHYIMIHNLYIIRQEFSPRIHLSDSDFASFTEGHCDADGTLGPAGFELAMRRQIKHAAQVYMCVLYGVMFNMCNI